MAPGLDELLDFLLSEIALLGVQGMHDSLRALFPFEITSATVCVAQALAF